MTRFWNNHAPLAGLILSACQMTSAQVAKPAVLVNPDDEVQAELNQAVAALSGFSSVLLSDTDLTRSSHLVIERKHQSNGNGELIQGRDLEMPQHFQLVLQDGQCWLVHQGSGKRQLLIKARCAANAPGALLSP